MNDYDGYLSVGQLIEEGRIDQRRLIAAGDSGELPIAIWADGFFITEYPAKNPAKYRLSPGEWLWLRTAYLRNFEGRKEIRMGKFRSGPNAEVDRFAIVGDPPVKPTISLSNMFISKESIRLVSFGAEPLRPALAKPISFYPAADGKKWVVGAANSVKLIKRVRGYEDIRAALRAPREDVLRAIFHVDNNAFIATHSSDPELDDKAMADIRNQRRELKENIKIALEEGLYDEADEYESDLKKLEKFAKGSFITPTKSKRLDKGDPMKKLTSGYRTRRRTAIKNLRKEGANDIADHVDKFYQVGDRYVNYSPDDPAPIWVLDPPAAEG